MVGKYVFNAGLGDKFKPKAACVCTDGGSRDGFAGFVTKGNFGVGIVCGVPSFDGQGGWNGTAFCFDWQLLAK